MDRSLRQGDNGHDYTGSQTKARAIVYFDLIISTHISSNLTVCYYYRRYLEAAGLRSLLRFVYISF